MPTRAKLPPIIRASSPIDIVSATPPIVAVSPIAAVPAARDVPAVNGAATIAAMPMIAVPIPTFLSAFFFLALAFIVSASVPFIINSSDILREL